MGLRFIRKRVQCAHIAGLSTVPGTWAKACKLLHKVRNYPVGLAFRRQTSLKLFLEKQLVRYMYRMFPVKDHHGLICPRMHNSNSPHLYALCTLNDRELTRPNSKKKKKKETSLNVSRYIVILVFLQTKDYWDNI